MNGIINEPETNEVNKLIQLLDQMDDVIGQIYSLDGRAITAELESKVEWIGNNMTAERKEDFSRLADRIHDYVTFGPNAKWVLKLLDFDFSN